MILFMYAKASKRHPLGGAGIHFFKTLPEVSLGFFVYCFPFNIPLVVGLVGCILVVFSDMGICLV